MRATDNYLRKHDDPEVIEKRGIFDKVFVREFAKLRWGVFDETPLKTSGKDSEFYVDPDMPAEKSLTPIKESIKKIEYNLYELYKIFLLRIFLLKYSK